MINHPLDLYDDPTGEVLKSRISDPSQFPEFIKTAERLTPEEMDKLPDDVFALVAFDGPEKMRKFACVDKGNTALSVIYFLENNHVLPEEAMEKAAANLITACGWYELEPPDQLLELAADTEIGKEAALGALMGTVGAGMTMADAGKKFQKRQQALKAGMPGQQVMKVSELSGTHQMPATKTASLPGKAYSMKETAKRLFREGKVKGVLERSRKQGVGALAVGPRMGEFMKDPETVKAMARGRQAVGKWVGKTKKASLDPYVDITGKEPHGFLVKRDRHNAQHHCMVKEGEARYPIDTATQVERADDYFRRFKDRFSPLERREYCVKLASRASELGFVPSDEVRDYASKDMELPRVKVAVYTRMRHWREGSSERGLLQEMMDKCASVKPEVLAVALEHFDQMTGMDKMWDKEIPDPYASVFGMVKQAEWSFTHGNESTTETRLKDAAKRRLSAIKQHFGEDLAEEFRKDPVQIFGSLPLDSKRIIMRIAGQVEE